MRKKMNIELYLKMKILRKNKFFFSDHLDEIDHVTMIKRFNVANT